MYETDFKNNDLKSYLSFIFEIYFNSIYNMHKGVMNMNIFDLMDSKTTSFSKTDRDIYESIKKFPKQFAYNSITDLSNQSGFTKPSLTRFAKKLGFNGFVEFQFQFSKDFQDISRHPKRTLAQSYSLILNQTEETVSQEQLSRIKDIFFQAQHIYLSGANLCRLVAQELDIINRLTNIDVNIIFPGIDNMPLKYKKNDVLMIYSVINGQTHARILKQIRLDPHNAPYLILVTTNSKHPLRHHFDEIVVLPSSHLSDMNISAISDTFAFLMFNELLLQELKK